MKGRDYTIEPWNLNCSKKEMMWRVLVSDKVAGSMDSGPGGGKGFWESGFQRQ